ncbi:hypothetical protein C1X59_05740 [Pseudomonas sp. FW215-R2]|uniref:hypothetical protein n=1 Tax=unclassified Pseudomonas TaxID=196821 RepID=UPI000C886B29|nr:MULTISPECIES: hypothetical protein [unclassified Pseudomonas]PMX03125.1 hypothetical protein C1X59_05740 [Pseudomonas sp. FW215-R2]PMX11909.1 hypothetical protein C1X60_04920 [Pseudomonas sp. FW215-L1]PMX25579.1 hypothetical protein C1X57_03660 [Pseudomonas sp. FW215-E1]PNA32581.1 hypothetical protein C1X58_03140 [Pseudomonas sp. FW215-R4]
MKLPESPYPSIGEIVYEIATRSGLVLSTEGTGFYDDLKAFKDERKRPGLDPIEIPTTILLKLEKRLAAFIGDELFANSIFVAWRRWLEYYTAVIARHDAGLLGRRDMMYLLWPTVFAFGGGLVLKMIHHILPIVPLEKLLSDPAPFGYLVKAFCTWEVRDYAKICEYRAEANGIDLDNCRDTLDEWLKGQAVPNLDRAQEILQALGLGNEFAPKLWIVTSRLLGRTPLKYRKAISNHLNLREDAGSFLEAFYWRKRQLSMERAKGLDIGPDRPYSELREALYDPAIPRDAHAVEDMLIRLERTWSPIAEETYHIINWLRGRFLVLSGQEEKAMKCYQDAYVHGMGREAEVFDHVLPEALALAGKLGKKKWVARFDSLLSLHWKGDWDGDSESLGELFKKYFDSRLLYRRDDSQQE